MRLVTCAIPALALAATTATTAAQSIALVNVNVVPMRGPAVLAGRSVIVRDGRVAAIGPAATTAVPRGVTVIDGRGTMYVAPGLIDAHVHLDRGSERWMSDFVRYGVTTVFNLRGTPPHLELQRAVAEGAMAGPRIFTSGPFANLPGVQSDSDAVRLVREQVRAGYDFVKIHGDLTPRAFRAMTAAGRRAGIPVIGHAPRNLPLDSAIAVRQTMLAHAEEIMYTHFGASRDLARAAELGRRMRAAGMWLTPNLSAYTAIARQVGRPAWIDSVLALTEAATLDTAIVRFWHSGMYTGRPAMTAPGYERNRAFLSELVGRLHAAGVRMLAGTDAPLPGLLPGASLHWELELLIAAGLSRRDALATATVNAGEFLREHGRTDGVLGVIERGAVADLLLLASNPLDDLSVLRRPATVIREGRVVFRRPSR